MEIVPLFHLTPTPKDLLSCRQNNPISCFCPIFGMEICKIFPRFFSLHQVLVVMQNMLSYVLYVHVMYITKVAVAKEFKKPLGNNKGWEMDFKVREEFKGPEVDSSSSIFRNRAAKCDDALKPPGIRPLHMYKFWCLKEQFWFPNTLMGAYWTEISYCTIHSDIVRVHTDKMWV